MSDHSAELNQPVASFLNAEARLMDGNEYSEWLDLFATECLYWIPSNHEDADPSKHVSILYCDRAMLENHVRRLVEGKAFAQSPRSRTSRIVSNIDVSESATGISASANFLITELRGHVQHLHAGRSEYKLRKIDSGFLIQQKKVVLLGLDEPQDNVTFLL